MVFQPGSHRSQQSSHLEQQAKKNAPSSQFSCEGNSWRLMKDFSSVYSINLCRTANQETLPLKYSKKTCYFPQTSSAQITSFCLATAM